jgi:glycosyltransferase involved in cell wall biosynthesis
MIYVCVPAHNEASTVGLVLWKVRQVFTAFEREYQILACDDASTDGTADVLTSYARVLPLTVIKHRSRQGYARSLEELLRVALQRTDRPKRDCAITLHADFVHGPETMEEMVKRLESGADLVVAEQSRIQGDSSWQERWARQWAPRLLRVGAGVRDSISGFLALRLIVLRQATRAGEAALLRTEGWCANAELLARLGTHARRVEVVPSAARYDLKQRASRSSPWQQLLSAWRSRGLISAARKGSVAVCLGLLMGVTALSAQKRDTVCTGVIVGPGTSSVTPSPAPPPVPPPIRPAPAVTFPVGEKLSYSAKYGVFSVGSASMEVVGIDTLRGAETVHIRFQISGGALWYKLNQTIESWVGLYDFRSRRFWSVQDERDRHRERKYDIFPDSGFYREEGRDTTFATVLDPLDDAAFLYWIRTVPLEVGKRYEYARYFRPDRNPVIVEVLGRDRVSVAGKKWRAIVVRPRIPQARGIFGEKSETRIWLSDDEQRLVLAIQSNFSFGQVTLKLKDYTVSGVNQP